MKQDFSSAFVRILILLSAFILFYLLIAVRLWNEQIREGEEHREKVSRQSIRRIRIPGIRGRVFSSDMKILADSAPCYDIVFHPAEMRQPGKRKKTISHILKCASEMGSAIGRKHFLTEEIIIRHINMTPALPVTVFRNLNQKELAAASEFSPPIQGMEIIAAPMRRYPNGKTACHLLGYVGMEDPGTAEDKSKFSYYIPDMRGITGVEKKYDKDICEGPVPLRGLQGEAGSSLVRINNLGYIHETIGVPVPCQNGNDIVLTVDFKAQKIAEEMFEEVQGAFVLLNAGDGAVIAMVSSPGFDPQLFVPRISSAEWKKLGGDSGRPMFNRAAMGTYTPGSILKPLIALSLLEHGISPSDTVACGGIARIGNAGIRCWSWKNGGHGEMNFIDAIEQSCNVYFITQGKKTGLEKISEMLKSAGIGRKTGFCLPEREGQLPSREAKYRNYGKQWNIYDTSLLSIGQGIILITPLQAALYAGAVANGGVIWKPYLIKEVRDSKGNRLFVKDAPEKTGELKVRKEYLELVKEGMRLVVNGEKGTAKRACSQKIMLYGKTGTAEIDSGSEDRTTNTWFIGFGEYGGSLYSFAILVEEGVSGGSTCAPMAKDFFEQWLD